MAEKLTNSVQENLLVILAFDDESAFIVRNSVEPELFEGIYQDIASYIYGFLDRFDEAPKTHLPDIMDTIIEGSDKPKSDLYTKTLANIIQLNEQGINTEYTLSRLNSFLRGQRLKQGILEAAEIVQDSSEESLDRAEHVLTTSMESSLDLFDPGVFLSSSSFLDFANVEYQEPFPTGIPEFEYRGIGPRRQEMAMVLGGTKSGKSTFMLHMAMESIMQRYKVLYISLEMSEMVAAQRMAQMLYSFTQNENSVTYPTFEKDGLGHLIGIDYQTIKRPSMRDPDFNQWIQNKQSSVGSRYGDNLVIKNFPTDSLSISGLEAYLDSLERMNGFVPDVVIVDYPTLMKLDNKQDLRIGLGQAVKGLRGIAGERNIAMVAPTQSNRSGMESQTLDETDIAEDISQTQTVDLLLAISKTETESQQGLARINVPLARNQESGFSVVVTQNLNTMQFVIDTHLVTNKYYDLLEREA